MTCFNVDYNSTSMPGRRRVYGHLPVNMAISDLSFNVNPNASPDSKLGEIAAKFAIQHFDNHYATLLFFNSTLYCGVEVFLRLYNNNIMINWGMFDLKLANNTRQFVLFGDFVADLEQIFDVVREHKMDNNGKFIFICQSNDCNENYIMELCWTYKIVNIVFIKLEAIQAVGFTYFPVADGICNNVKPIKLDLDNQYMTTTYGEIYGNKLKNLNLCLLTMSTFIQPPYMNISNGIPSGADGDLLRIIAYGLNTSLAMMTPHRGDGWGWRQSNGTWMGSLADVDEGLANFSMTSSALTLTRFVEFQISTSYYSSEVVWVTHPAQLQNVALRLMHPFEPYTRIALVVSLFLLVLCAFLVKTDSWTSICRIIDVIQPTKSIVFYGWMICMGQALIKLPTRSAFLQMTLIWVWYCFLVRTVYQVYLISALKGKFYEDQFVSIDDAIYAKYPFGGGAALKDYYSDYPLVYDNWINIDTNQIIPTALNISKGMKFVLAMNSDAAKTFIKTNKVRLHILPQKVITSPTVIFLKKYSPLSESIDDVLNKLSASGFPDKLHKKYTSFYVDKNNGNEGETLKIVSFTACYFILIFGWVLSTIFFCLEFYFGKIYRHPIQTL